MGIMAPTVRARVAQAVSQDGGTLTGMSDANIAEILKLPAEERMRLAEIIWASLAADPSGVPLGDAHRAVIDERLAEHERNPGDVVSLDEALKEARRR
jgi:putative addiction module component (TIGR02574 family)